MKIKLFMWLVHHRKILTWDNLKKRGMLGPSRCHLYETQEETIEHPLNNCIFTDKIWECQPDKSFFRTRPISLVLTDI